MAKTRRSWRIAPLLCGVSLLSVNTAVAGGHVRFDNDRIAEVFHYAMWRSPSFRELVATLEMLDRVVYVEEGKCRNLEQHSCLVLMPTPGAKNLLVRIDPRQQVRLVVAQLAHELYHAAEVGREPGVVDEASLRDLYERIGERRCSWDGDDCWETRAAETFKALVMRELEQSAPPKTE
jgi:hypothetical protein